jgi:hypothetical protein
MTEGTEIDALPDPELQSELTDADARGCRFIDGEPTPIRAGMFCCVKTLPGENWCARHRRVVWQRARRRPEAA